MTGESTSGYDPLNRLSRIVGQVRGIAAARELRQGRAVFHQRRSGRRPSAEEATTDGPDDPDRTDIAQLSGWVRDCGYHCAGQSVPEHMCDPMAEPDAITSEVHPGHVTHGLAGRSAQDVMGDGGGHGGVSMENMVVDMRNSFLVAAVRL